MNELVKQSGYAFDNSVCIGSVTNQKAREVHLRYHAEKKALAILLHLKVEPLTVAISLMMCRDCRAFFAAMSRHFEQTITCFDTNGKHEFDIRVTIVYSAPNQHMTVGAAMTALPKYLGFATSTSWTATLRVVSFCGRASH